MEVQGGAPQGLGLRQEGKSGKYASRKRWRWLERAHPPCGGVTRVVTPRQRRWESEGSPQVGLKEEEERAHHRARSPGEPWSEAGRRVVLWAARIPTRVSPRGGKDGSFLYHFELVSSEEHPKIKIQGK